MIWNDTKSFEKYANTLPHAPTHASNNNNNNNNQLYLMRVTLHSISTDKLVALLIILQMLNKYYKLQIN